MPCPSLMPTQSWITIASAKHLSLQRNSNVRNPPLSCRQCAGHLFCHATFNCITWSILQRLKFNQFLGQLLSNKRVANVMAGLPFSRLSNCDKALLATIRFRPQSTDISHIARSCCINRGRPNILKSRSLADRYEFLKWP